jgi:nucleotide-binding universal stress UspA family protein
MTSPSSPTPLDRIGAAPARPQRVVAAFDGTPLGERAVEEALRLCAAYPAAELHVITVGAELSGGVLLPAPGTPVLPNDSAQEAARLHVARIVEDYLTRGGPSSVEKVAVYVVAGTPSERIVALALSIDADLIVLGTHGRHGLGRWLLGSVADAVLESAPCGVFVIRPRDFLDGEKLPEIQPPLQPHEHALLPFRTQPTYHYVHRMSREEDRLMPAI